MSAGLADSAKTETINHMNNQAIATRENLVSQQISRIESYTNQIHGFINNLEVRIAIVLNDVPACDNNQKQPQERMPELAAILRDRADELQDATSRFELLLSRIELPGAMPKDPPSIPDGLGAGLKGYPSMIKR